MMLRKEHTSYFYNTARKWWLDGLPQSTTGRYPSLERCILNRRFLTIFDLVVTLTFWLQNLIGSSLSRPASKLYIWWNSHKQFVRYRVHIV